MLFSNMRKATLGFPAISLLVAVLLIFAGCIFQTPAPSSSGKLKVVATFYPLYDFAKNVGGDRVELSTIIPMGVEPHDYDPSPSSMRAVAGADVFIYNGAGLEPWAQQLISGAGSQNLISVDSSQGINLISSGASSDPHIWLDPALAKIQVANIRDAFIRADPEGKAQYEANAAAYIAKLDALDSQLRAEFATCKKKDILITHATLAYFCREYGCRQIAIEGVNEEGEPSAADIVKIIQQAKANNVSAVFFESMVNPQSAQLIANEINGTAAVFNSVHGLTPQEQSSGADYISLMQSNLGNVKKALDCN